MLSLVYPFRNTLVSLALAALVVSAEPGAHVRPRTPLNIARRHHNVTLSESETRLGKRFENTRFTFFGVGQNACGSFDHDGDFIVALNTHQWDDGSHCYAPITVSYQGKSANAKITDECEECPYGAIDLSPGSSSTSSQAA
ncbi:hypothetical protein C8Q80DRAFT_1293786 [Daedaleopsis nitida]|nr:hypothetical protein C8Q80DRAFT_1293786 [Daedaleopsis nitida]